MLPIPLSHAHFLADLNFYGKFRVFFVKMGKKGLTVGGISVQIDNIKLGCDENCHKRARFYSEGFIFFGWIYCKVCAGFVLTVW
jgi:hypothetical protein